MAIDYYDDLEIQEPEIRARHLVELLRRQIAHAKSSSRTQRERLARVDPQDIQSVADLRLLPVLRKSELSASQARSLARDPFGGYAACGWNGVHSLRRAKRVFQSPGPIYEPQGAPPDSLRAARALHAAGFRSGDLVHNSFSYHMTPAGVLMEEGAHVLGCAVFPAGIGNSDLQLKAILDLRPHAYTGTPGFLKTLIQGAERSGQAVSIRKALFSGEAFPPSLREWMLSRNVDGYQCYASADLGMIAYETTARDGLVVDEGVVVEILNPVTEAPVLDGEIGEVVVTTFSLDYPLIRFATGDLSATLPGRCPTGRTNVRLRGWLGRADQSTKVRGMFVHPVQVSEVLRRHTEVRNARLVIEGQVSEERMLLVVEVANPSAHLESGLIASLREVTKLRAEVQMVPIGELAEGSKLIEDRRIYE